MERLTKRSNKTVHENGVCCTHFRGKECSERMGECTDNCPWEEAVWSKLADYEDAEEQGLLLRLPCKVGDTVFLVQRRRVYERKVSGFSVTSNNRFVVHMSDFEGDNATFLVEKFGKQIFLTREEAESALAEKGGAE